MLPSLPASVALWLSSRAGRRLTTGTDHLWRGMASRAEAIPHLSASEGPHHYKNLVVGAGVCVCVLACLHRCLALALVWH